MSPSVPEKQVTLMLKVYRKIFPQVDKELQYWTGRALEIPDPELKRQALASIRTKRFHCQGGAVFALLAGDRWKEAVRFIVAYQTISDYLDNLCDRSTSMNPDDFSLLHHSMFDALSASEPVMKNYYAHRKEQRDGGYLQELVKTCQKVISCIHHYQIIQPSVHKLEMLYADLQIHKHVRMEERLPRLTTWHRQHRQLAPDLTWYEFAAAAGSTLGIFTYITYGLSGKINKELTNYIWKGYFPYIQALHILLDYYIDQMEDKMEGDLNFCSYYPDQLTMLKRFYYLLKNGEELIINLPDAKFHKMIIQGLVALYLGDQKADHIAGGEKTKQMLLKYSGIGAQLFHWNIKLYHSIKNRKQTYQ